MKCSLLFFHPLDPDRNGAQGNLDPYLHYDVRTGTSLQIRNTVVMKTSKG